MIVGGKYVYVLHQLLINKIIDVLRVNLYRLLMKHLKNANIVHNQHHYITKKNVCLVLMVVILTRTQDHAKHVYLILYMILHLKLVYVLQIFHLMMVKNVSLAILGLYGTLNQSYATHVLKHLFLIM
jgi:hypothetical protein